MKILRSKLNKAWHLDHKMPPKATLDQRIKWHSEHIRHCGCRDVPQKLKDEISQRERLQKKE